MYAKRSRKRRAVSSTRLTADCRLEVPIKTWTGEALAARFALECAKRLGSVETEIAFQGDSLEVYNEILDTNATPDWIIEGEILTCRKIIQE